MVIIACAAWKWKTTGSIRKARIRSRSGLKQYYEFPCDAVVFAVGDKVDETVGLPYKSGMFVTNPNKTGNDPDDALFQAYDETTGKIMDGVFLAGWARKASEGLVGIAKRDGDWCAWKLSAQIYLDDKRRPEEPSVNKSRRSNQAHTRIFTKRTSTPAQCRRESGLRIRERLAIKWREQQYYAGETGRCIGEFKCSRSQSRNMLKFIEARERMNNAELAPVFLSIPHFSFSLSTS